MGIHDFSSAIYSQGELEGEQTLEIPAKSDRPIYDKNQLATEWAEPPSNKDDVSVEMYQVEKDQYEDESSYYKEELEGEEIPNPRDIVETYQEDIFEAGTGEAVLEFFIFPENLNVMDNFDKMVKEGRYTERFYRPYKYSWDSWDFHDEEEEDWLNYYDSQKDFDKDMPIVWQVRRRSEKELQDPRILDEKDGQVWVRNFTKHGYDNYILASEPDPYLSNLDLSYVAFLFNIDYRGKTRTELFKLIKAKLNEVFSIEDNLNVKKTQIQKKILIKKTGIEDSQKMQMAKHILTNDKCLGITSKNVQCSRVPKKGQEYCFQHIKSN